MPGIAPSNASSNINHTDNMAFSHAKTGGAYHAKATEDTTTEGCPEFETQFTNFVFQVQMTFRPGSFGRGIEFRLDANSNHFVETLETKQPCNNK
jgi:hypothetical protein